MTQESSFRKPGCIGMKGLIIVLGMAVLLLFPSCFESIDALKKVMDTNAVLEVEYHGTEIKDLHYGDGEREVYDLYLPEDTTDPKATHLILFIHGGSWKSGDKKDGQYWCRNLASKGYTTASISYTLKTKKTDTNIVLVNSQVRAAVEAIKAKCAELGITLVDMATNGFSAGACQAMLYGWDTESQYGWDAESHSSIFPVRFIIQQSGPTTIEPAVWRNGEIHPIMLNSTGLDGSAKGDAEWISQFCGETVTEEMVKDGSAEAYWKKVSPYTFITDSSVPVVFAYGVLDGIVPPSSRVILEQALQNHNVQYTCVIYENSGHMVACDLDKQRLFIEYVDKYCAKYFLGEEFDL